MMEQLVLNNQWISLENLEHHFSNEHEVVLGEKAKHAVSAGCAFLQEKVSLNDRPYYGVNTGFGSLCDTQISSDDLQQLQINLLRSHACGMGEKVPAELVKRMLLLKAIALAKGYSGVQLATVERLLFFYNNDILPVVFEQGSLGASGDLAPLAHLSLPLIGEGEVLVEGEIIPAYRLKELYDIEPIQLQAKEGLALLNGTQFMNAYSTYAINVGFKVFSEGLAIAALSLEAYDGKPEPFQSNVNDLRKQQGQIEVAARMRNLLHSTTRAKLHVQDPYSFRCIPQVHGATLDVLNFVKTTFENELNAVTDNPTLFPEEDQIVSAGNFHGQPLALAMDFLAIAMAELGSISERRIYKLISGTRELPPFLVKHAGLNSGFMIVQYSAASMVSQNKQLCTPSSVDTIDSSNGQEDHVSMGANAATKCKRVIENVISITALEWLTACQAFDFRMGWDLGSETKAIFEGLRQHISFMETDRYLHNDMVNARDLLIKRLR
ncbi:MAG: histidine ammonia-lyase [Flavobacteriia bacterium]|nr:histidine ammonia-lyase [Flavobacteriia bacterium]